jgi:hypothetical protein
LSGDLPTRSFQSQGAELTSGVVSHNDSVVLPSDKKISLLADHIARWIANEDLSDLLTHDKQVADKANKAALANTRVEHNALKLDLKHLHAQRDEAYTKVAAKLHKTIDGPHYGEESRLLKSVISGQHCQISVLRDVLHGLVKQYAGDQVGQSVSNNEGVLV